MKDYWNDPPDHPEPPEWFMELEAAIEHPNCPANIATAVRCQLDDWCAASNGSDFDPGPEPVVELPDDFAGPEKCPHGREWTECDACDHLSDLAYDAARESR